jgi:two-component system nitrogen regulation response regulator GlnG
MARPSKPRDYLVSESAAMREVADRIDELADRDVPVLVEGEPGTGRELIARVIHLSSARRLQDFVSVKGGTAPTGTFSDSSGATSSSVLRRANGGTLLVKDLVALPKRSQQRLRKLLGRRTGNDEDTTITGVVDVRVVATTDPELGRAVDAGVFSADLYRCFLGHTLIIPPLRERVADIPPLASNLVRGYGRTMGRKRIRISTRAFDRMVAYAWPGNVAELKAVCRRLAVRAEYGKVEPEDLEAVLPMTVARAPLEKTSFEDMVRAKLTEFLRNMDGYPIEGLYEQVLDRVERPLLSVIMEYTGNNQVKAAEILGLNRNTLRRKLSERGVRALGVSARGGARGRGKTAKGS